MIRLKSSTKQEHRYCGNAAKGDNPYYMKITPTDRRLDTERATVTLPIEIYSVKRIAEFDSAEADLDKVLRRRRAAVR